MTTPEAKPLFTESQYEELGDFNESLVERWSKEEITDEHLLDEMFRKMLAMKGQEMWVARDGDGELAVFWDEPLYCEKVESWHAKNYSVQSCMDQIQLTSDLFPNLPAGQKQRAFLVPLGVE